MKNISLVPASYKGLTFSELSLPHAHFRAMQWERYEQRLYRSPSLICNNSISPVSNNVSWQRKHSLLWKSDRHTGTMHVNSHRRYPAPVSQEKGKCNRNWMQVFGGRITSLICSHYLPLCCYQNDRNDLGNLLDVWYRHSSVLKSILVEFKVLHGVWKTNCLKKTSILWCRLLTQQGTLLHAWSLNSFSDTII